MNIVIYAEYKGSPCLPSLPNLAYDGEHVHVVADILQLNGHLDEDVVVRHDITQSAQVGGVIRCNICQILYYYVTLH